MQIRLIGWQNGSQGLAELQDAMQTIIAKRKETERKNVMRYGPSSVFTQRLQKPEHLSKLSLAEPTMIVQWGNAKVLTPKKYVKNGLFLNTSDLRQVTNKKTFFETYASYCPYLPSYVRTRGEAVAALAGVNLGNLDGSPVLVERQILDGHSGEGILLLKQGDTPTENGKLWTYYHPKSREFRVHFVRIPGNPANPLLHITEKLMKKSMAKAELPNQYQIRNLENGWIYANNLLSNPPAIIRKAAINLISHMSLDFGAIDIIYSKKTGYAWILEVNSAPGLAGSTPYFYAHGLLMLADSQAWEAKVNLSCSQDVGVSTTLLGDNWKKHLQTGASISLPPIPEPSTTTTENDNDEDDLDWLIDDTDTGEESF